MGTRAIRRNLGAALAVLAIATTVGGAPTTASAEPVSTETPLYYLENDYTGESMFTIDRNERDVMRAAGWDYESVPLILPTESAKPVYRMFNPYTDDHLFTQDPNECDTLEAMGWNKEGVKFYSDEAMGEPMYRLYASWMDGQGSHEYTTSEAYYEQQAERGWHQDGARWYGVRTPNGSAEHYQGLYSYPDLDYSQGGVGSAPGNSTAPVTPNADSQAVLDFARRYIGYPYVSGGDSPDVGFDCSGLTQWVYAHFGVDIPRTSGQQMLWLQARGTWTSDPDQLKPGDLIVMEYGSHVAIYVGKDPVSGRHMMIDAPGPGRRVVEREVYALSPGSYSGNSFLGGGSVF